MKRSPCSLLAGLLMSLVVWELVSCAAVSAEDWPEIWGAGRRQTWNETGIVRQFASDDLLPTWRTPIGAGYSGPAVAGGRVFISDYVKGDSGARERVLCLDEETGRVLWTHENPAAAYSKFAYNSGPRATPTVDGDRVYVLGAAGDLYCLEVKTGKLQWQVNLPERYQAKISTWGYAGSPIVHGDLLITPAGGQPDARIVGLNKLTGAEVWRALPVTAEIGYSSPIIIRAGGVDQLIYWVTGEIASLNPATGQVYWQVPFAGSSTCATPSLAGDRLIITNFFTGSILLKLAADQPTVEELWRIRGTSEAKSEGLHGLLCPPVFRGDYLYGVCAYGEFRCLEIATGRRVWESLEALREKARWASAFIVRNHDVYFINTDRGELIIADLVPEGWRELSRAQLIKPTSGDAGRRELGKVNWVIPAYANRHIVIRNDEEIIRVSLAQ